MVVTLLRIAESLRHARGKTTRHKTRRPGGGLGIDSLRGVGGVSGVALTQAAQGARAFSYVSFPVCARGEKIKKCLCRLCRACVSQERNSFNHADTLLFVRLLRLSNLREPVPELPEYPCLVVARQGGGFVKLD